MNARDGVVVGMVRRHKRQRGPTVSQAGELRLRMPDRPAARKFFLVLANIGDNYIMNSNCPSR